MMRGYLRWTGKDGRAEQNRKGFDRIFFFFFSHFGQVSKKKRATDLRKLLVKRLDLGRGK